MLQQDKAWYYAKQSGQIRFNTMVCQRPGISTDQLLVASNYARETDRISPECSQRLRDTCNPCAESGRVQGFFGSRRGWGRLLGARRRWGPTAGQPAPVRPTART